MVIFGETGRGRGQKAERTVRRTALVALRAISGHQGGPNACRTKGAN